MDIIRHELAVNELEIYSPQEAVDRRILRGRIFCDSANQKSSFVENVPSGPRSKEVGRTLHARMVKSSKTDEYKITFRFKANEKYLKETLLSEVRNLIKQLELK